MGLYLLKRLPQLTGEGRAGWLRDWQASDLVVDAEGGETRAVVSALSVGPAAGVGVPAEATVILRTGGSRRGGLEAEDMPDFAWMPKARERFRASIERLEARPGEYWLWPSAEGVLSDVPSTRSFFCSREGGNLRLLLDPASMLTRDMLPKAEDHLARIFAGLGGIAAAILLANIEPHGGLEGVQLSTLTRGVLSPKVVVELWREFGSEGTPVVVLDEDVAGQRAVLGM